MSMAMLVRFRHKKNLYKSEKNILFLAFGSNALGDVPAWHQRYQVLSSQTLLEKCHEVSGKISSGVTLTNGETRPRTASTGLAAYPHHIPHHLLVASINVNVA